MLDPTSLKSLGRPVHYFQTIDTTMREAGERAGRGEPHGTVVIAEEQTAGRGRLGRTWSSAPGAGLYFSLILRLELEAAQAPLVTLALGLAVARAIQQATNLACDLRWPNDVLLGGRKCCGILAELLGEDSRARSVIAGIGVNVNQREFSKDLAGTATSLYQQTGCEYSREALLAAILAEIDRHLAMLVDRGPAVIVELFSGASSYAAGKRVVVSGGAADLVGATAGLTASGTLLLRLDDGQVTPVVAGSVRPVEQ